MNAVHESVGGHGRVALGGAVRPSARSGHVVLVLVMLPNIVAWWEATVGLIKADVIAIPGTALVERGRNYHFEGRAPGIVSMRPSSSTSQFSRKR